MKKQFIIISIFFSLVLLSGFVLANQNCPSGIPNGFYGNIYVDGGLFGQDKPLVGEYTLIVMVDGATSGSQFIDDGTYDIDGSPCYGVDSGEITFIVNGVEARETEEYNSTSSISKNLTLTLKSQPSPDSGCGDEEINAGEECDDGNVISGDGCSAEICEVEFGYSCKGEPSVCSLLFYCGDSTCNNGETCSTCAGDCGACPVTSSGSHGGGGGGGGSSIKPAVIILSKNNTDNENATNPSSDLNGMDINSLNENHQETTNKGFFRITGLAIGDFVKTPAGKGTIASVLLLGILGVFFSFNKNKKNNSKNRKIKITKMSDMKKK